MFRLLQSVYTLLGAQQTQEYAATALLATSRYKHFELKYVQPYFGFYYIVQNPPYLSVLLSDTVTSWTRKARRFC